VLGGDEAALGLRRGAQRHDLLVDTGEVSNHLWVRVVALLDDLVPCDLLQHVQLLLRQLQRLAGGGVGQTGPALGDVDAVQQGVQSLALGGAHDLLAVDVVANVRVLVVVLQVDVADGVGLLGV
jgi:hypothetical protein